MFLLLLFISFLSLIKNPARYFHPNTHLDFLVFLGVSGWWVLVQQGFRSVGFAFAGNPASGVFRFLYWVTDELQVFFPPNSIADFRSSRRTLRDKQMQLRIGNGYAVLMRTWLWLGFERRMLITGQSQVKWATRKTTFTNHRRSTERRSPPTPLTLSSPPLDLMQATSKSH